MKDEIGCLGDSMHLVQGARFVLEIRSAKSELDEATLFTPKVNLFLGPNESGVKIV